MFEINWINLFNSVIVTIWFLYIFIPFFWMIVYEWRYYKNAGKDYLLYGKEYVKSKFIKISSGNLPPKK